MSILRHLLDRLCFPNMPPERLAVLRVLIGLFSLWYLSNRIDLLSDVAVTDKSLFAPVGVAKVLEAPLSVDTFEWIVIATLIANLLFAAGVLYRISGPMFAALLAFTLCYRNSWSMIYHSDNVLLLHVIVLGMARAADKVSIDAALFGRGSVAGPTNWRYGWPVQLMIASTTATYFLAGIAKVAGPSGWAWATGESLRSQVAVDALRKEVMGHSISPLAEILYDHVWLFAILATGSLVLELCAPLAILHRRLGQAWGLATFSMHWGIYFVMGITFRYCLSGIAFAALFPVERLLEAPRLVGWGSARCQAFIQKLKVPKSVRSA